MLRRRRVCACRFYGTYRGGNPRAWLLKIVRNACMDQSGRTAPIRKNEAFDGHSRVGKRAG